MNFTLHNDESGDVETLVEMRRLSPFTLLIHFFSSRYIWRHAGLAAGN